VRHWISLFLLLQAISALAHSPKNMLLIPAPHDVRNQSARALVTSSWTAPEASIDVVSSEVSDVELARQDEDFRAQINTGISTADRYLSFTIVTTVGDGASTETAAEVVRRFIPANNWEVPSYDKDGNLGADGRWNYTWDALDRLIRIESKPGAPLQSRHLIEYTYDAGGRRVALTNWVRNAPDTLWIVQSSRKFVYDGWDMVAELDGVTGQTVRTYGWLGKSGGLLWIKDSTGEFHIPSFDGNRNVMKLIKYSDKSISAEYEYEPFGDVIRSSGPMAKANPFRFSSEYHDEVTGLVYYGYRYYSPQTRRWLSRDPIGFAGGPNLYGFVANDPVNWSDYYGLCMEDKLKKLDSALSQMESGMQRAAEFGETIDDFLDPGSAQLRDFVNSKADQFRSWWADTADEIGRGMFDLAMGDDGPGRYDPNTMGALRAELGYGIDRNNNGLRDASGAGARIIAQGALALGEAYAMGRLGAPVPGGGKMPKGSKAGTPKLIACPVDAAESGSLLPVKYDPKFAAEQLLGGNTVTPGGRTIMDHAARRMVDPPAGRAGMTMQEIDQVLDTGTKIKKVTPHPMGTTVTVQHPGMPGKPQVVVDGATGQRVITVIKQN